MTEIHLFSTASIFFLMLSTSVRLMSGFVLLKYLAFRFGPQIFGQLTQLMAVAAIVYMFAGGGITNGLIRNLSANSSPHQRKRWMSAGATINLLASLTLSSIVVGLWAGGAGSLLGIPDYKTAFPCIAAAQIVVGLGHLVLSYYSGVGDNRSFAMVQVTAHAGGLITVIALAQAFGLDGAMLGLVFAPAMIGVVALWRFCRHATTRSMLRVRWEWPLLSNLTSYAAAKACAVMAIPLAQLLIRLDMSRRFGWTSVGYWQGVAKLSDAYMLLVGVVFTNYLLPQLSLRHDDVAALHALRRFGAVTLAIAMVAGAAIYVTRTYIMVIVYSRDFLSAANLMLPQLCGDVFRIAGLLLYYYIVSRGRILTILVSDLLQGVSLYVLYEVLVRFYGAAAPVYGHAVNGALLLFTMLGLLARSRRAQPVITAALL